MRFCLDVILATAVLGNLSAASLPATPEAGNAAAVRRARAVWTVKVDTRTGQLVRTLAALPGSSAAPATDVRGLVAEAAKNFDVNPLLVDSVIQVESNYNPFAVSPKGARGLMQLMPGTAQRFGVTDTFDAKQNIEGGVRYLKFLEDTFQDDRLAIAAYNAGEQAVAKYKDVPPYPETVSYVAKVGKKYGQAQRAAQDVNDSKTAAKKAQKAEGDAVEEEPRHIQAFVDPEGKLHIATR
jgi:soluble lytic murein transglycosylase-like protein